ncbi:unnamed protein product [Plutella xylostella]|uniref:RNA-directed DNA polymerase n=1 Tax=Plutella xylostella TaxID=51655 RepID=A0A8S4G975_PLUXY|nr:unnamed protein product [Plutella xylostella]
MDVDGDDDDRGQRSRSPIIVPSRARRSRSRSRQGSVLRSRRRVRTPVREVEYRSRSRIEVREQELDLERQRLQVLESQLLKERELRDLRQNAMEAVGQRGRDLHPDVESQRRRRSVSLDDTEASIPRRCVGDRDRELRDRRRSIVLDNDRPGHDSTSVLIKEFLKEIKNQSGERDSFPSSNNNVIPEFDPMCKEQTITVWLNKVVECAEIYRWNEMQTIHYALSKLTGYAKKWYAGLPSLKRSWEDWKSLLVESFPATENYADLLSEMLSKRARFGESLELYYFSKTNLLNRCKIFGRDAVDCLIHGVDDRGVRLGAQAAKCDKPEEVLSFFKTVKGSSKDTVFESKRHKKPNGNSNYNRFDDKTSQFKTRKFSDVITCFNCKEKGHLCTKCPKPIIKCSYCHLIGHIQNDCPKKNAKPEMKDKNILRILVKDHESMASKPHLQDQKITDLTDDNSSSKYKMVIKVDGFSVACQVDLGSEATLIRKSNAQALGLHWDTVSGPLLRGLGNIPYLPLGKLRVDIEVQGVKEMKVDVLVVDDHLINCPILLGHTFTERPNVRILKTAYNLAFEKVDPINDTKLFLTTEYDETVLSGEMKAIRTISNQKLDGNVYVGGSVRGPTGNEYYLMPGEYELDHGSSLLLIQNLSTNPVTFPKGSLITRAWFIGSEKHVLNVAANFEPQMDEPEVNCGDSLTADEKHKLYQLLKKFKDCFSSGLHDLGYSTETEMVIHLKDSEPVVYRPYRLSYAERKVVQSMIDEMVDCGIVRESNSPYASPIVLVPKKSGEKRLCVDYRALNRITKRDHYPLPRIEDLLDQLSGQCLFTTLDLASGYHQIPIAEESKEKTAFVTPDGQYEYNRMPFGLANAPAVFQRAMHKILAQIKYVIVYMDDILVPASSFDEGLDRLNEVLTSIRKSGFTLKMEKCNFFQENIVFLGFEIDSNGVKPGLQKTQAVANFPTPTNQHDIRRFIGLASYFRRFIKGFAIIARPLTNLLKKDTNWQWTSNEQSAFENLKTCLTERPVLALYDPMAETQLHTDASKIGLAGILLQRNGSDPWRPVSYYSRQTTADEQKLHSFELETLAVVSSLAKFRVYLVGIKFTIVTDCNALRSTFTKRDLVPRISRWWIQFLEYDCEIEYRPGEKMAHVDALSRSPVTEPKDHLHTLDVLSVNREDWVVTVQSADAEIKRIKEILEDPETPKISGIHREYRIKKQPYLSHN